MSGGAAAVAEVRMPELIMMPVPSFHPDHQWVYGCCVAATRSTKPGNPLRIIAAFEYPPAGWGNSSSWDSPHGEIYINISRHLPAKIAMLEQHKLQRSMADYALISVDEVKRLASFRGLEAGYDYAVVDYICAEKWISAGLGVNPWLQAGTKSFSDW